MPNLRRKSSESTRKSINSAIWLGHKNQYTSCIGKAVDRALVQTTVKKTKKPTDSGKKKPKLNLAMVKLRG